MQPVLWKRADTKQLQSCASQALTQDGFVEVPQPVFLADGAVRVVGTGPREIDLHETAQCPGFHDRRRRPSPFDSFEDSRPEPRRRGTRMNAAGMPRVEYEQPSFAQRITNIAQRRTERR